jgi:hypothetical protein
MKLDRRLVLAGMLRWRRCLRQPGLRRRGDHERQGRGRARWVAEQAKRKGSTLSFHELSSASVSAFPPTTRRKAFLRALSVWGSKSALLRILVAASSGNRWRLAFAVLKWRTRHDSNVWPPPSEGGALSS